MHVSQLTLYIGAVFILAIAPGPDNIQVLVRGISQGRMAGFVAACGFAFGVIFHTTIAAVGLAAVLRASPVAFQIKITGYKRVPVVQLIHYQATSHLLEPNTCCAAFCLAFA